MADRSTIVLIGDLAEQHDERRAAAGSAIKPGHLIQVGASDEVNVHSTAGGYAEILVAKEDPYQGRTIDDAYDPGDPVFFHRAKKGDKLYMILNAGENVDMTEFLTSNGDGTLKVAATTDQRLFKPAEPLDLSGGGAVDTRIPVYVL